VLPAPFGPVLLCAVVLSIPLIERVPAVLIPAAATLLPFWVFLFVIHGILRGYPLTALAIACRVTALVVVFLTTLAVVHPARLVDAMVARGLPFSAAYLLSATLQSVPRLRRRGKEILDAQRCRGLAVRGLFWRRARAIVPLALSLILSALAEVDERALALEARGAGHVTRRTPLDPPADSPTQKVLRWGMVAVALTAIVLRIASP
jgi:energy-coupling factor transport system permease protein